MLKNCLQYILSVLKDVEGVLGFPGDTVVKNPPTMQETQETQVVIPGLGRCPGIGHGNPLLYSCLENFSGQRDLAGCSPWGCRELDMAE